MSDDIFDELSAKWDELDQKRGNAPPPATIFEELTSKWDALDAERENSAETRDPNPGRKGAPELPQLKGVVGWFQGLKPSDRQAAYDFIGQSIGTGVGITAGASTSPATGPVGPVVGGAAGNAGGKWLSRLVGPYIGGEGEPPDLLSAETAIDAAMGTVGPVASRAGKGIVRSLTGATKEVAETASEEAAKAGAQSRKSSMADRFEDMQKTHDTTLKGTALKNIGDDVGAAAQRGGQIASLAHLITTGDVVGAAAWLAGGKAASAAQRSAAEALLNQKWFREWVVREGYSTKVQVFSGLGALLAKEELAPGNRKTVLELLGEAGEDAERYLKSKSVPRSEKRSELPRDPRGRFASAKATFDDTDLPAGYPRHGDTL